MVLRQSFDQRQEYDVTKKERNWQLRIIIQKQRKEKFFAQHILQTYRVSLQLLNSIIVQHILSTYNSYSAATTQIILDKILWNTLWKTRHLQGFPFLIAIEKEYILYEIINYIFIKKIQKFGIFAKKKKVRKNYIFTKYFETVIVDSIESFFGLGT